VPKRPLDAVEHVAVAEAVHQVDRERRGERQDEGAGHGHLLDGAVRDLGERAKDGNLVACHTVLDHLGLQEHGPLARAHRDGALVRGTGGKSKRKVRSCDAAGGEDDVPILNDGEVKTLPLEDGGDTVVRDGRRLGVAHGVLDKLCRRSARPVEVTLAVESQTLVAGRVKHHGKACQADERGHEDRHHDHDHVGDKEPVAYGLPRRHCCACLSSWLSGVCVELLYHRRAV
jgi:hypothetical protein